MSFPLVGTFGAIYYFRHSRGMKQPIRSREIYRINARNRLSWLSLPGEGCGVGQNQHSTLSYSAGKHFLIQLMSDNSQTWM